MVSLVKIKRVFVANRGDSAVRIEQTCKRLGIETVAIFTESDRNSLHVKLADEAYLVSSYMNAEEIVALALETGCQAIHAGYGFLSEKAEFVKLCEQKGICFVGPSSPVIERMGNKMNAKQAAREAQVLVLQATKVLDLTGILQEIEQSGMSFPVVVKAAGGGGGLAIEVVTLSADLEQAALRVQTQAQRLFGNPSVYVESYVAGAAHIEVQIVADQYGNVIHLGERECSLQRRLQKLIEETPSSKLTNSQREEICNAAVRLASAVGYTGIGTVEFLFDPVSGKFYFLEMNTRIQVEHAITEMVTGIDLVEIQFLIAEGCRLDDIYVRGTKLTDIKPQGWAMEGRIYPERLRWIKNLRAREFVPNPGAYALLEFSPQESPWVRLDTVLEPRSPHTPQIAAEYSNLLARLITWGATRDEALHRMKGALKETIITVGTNIPFLQVLIELEEFEGGTHHIQTLGNQATLAKIGARIAQLEREELGRVLFRCQALL